MKKLTFLVLASVSMAAFGTMLAGCGSGDADVDQAALNSRNAQRSGAAHGAPPAPKGVTPGATSGK